MKKVGDVLTVIVSPISNVSFVVPPTDGENLADADFEGENHLRGEEEYDGQTGSNAGTT